jgi:hypothetical protein
MWKDEDGFTLKQAGERDCLDHEDLQTRNNEENEETQQKETHKIHRKRRIC